ncbi:hypothetical protein [Sinomicrobium sp. M5D2P9]
MIFRISIILMFTLFWSGNPFSEEKCVVRIGKGSELYLKGSANVRDFTCVYDRELLETSVPVSFRKKQDRMIFDQALIRLENKGFGCGGKGINRDFHSLLQTETYPYIDLNLKEVTYKTGKTTALISITIAGVIKTYNIPVQLDTEGRLQCSGILPLDIRDFGLQPPKKMLGLIVVDEKIDIYFDLSLKIAK